MYICEKFYSLPNFFVTYLLIYWTPQFPSQVGFFLSIRPTTVVVRSISIYPVSYFGALVCLYLFRPTMWRFVISLTSHHPTVDCGWDSTQIHRMGFVLTSPTMWWSGGFLSLALQCSGQIGIYLSSPTMWWSGGFLSLALQCSGQMGFNLSSPTM